MKTDIVTEVKRMLYAAAAKILKIFRKQDSRINEISHTILEAPETKMIQSGSFDLATINIELILIVTRTGNFYLLKKCENPYDAKTFHIYRNNPSGMRPAGYLGVYHVNSVNIDQRMSFMELSNGFCLKKVDCTSAVTAVCVYPDAMALMPQEFVHAEDQRVAKLVH